eukprot:scaffold138264_cov15-Tisochrysis_lutea.AAC.1
MVPLCAAEEENVSRKAFWFWVAERNPAALVMGQLEGALQHGREWKRGIELLRDIQQTWWWGK